MESGIRSGIEGGIESGIKKWYRRWNKKWNKMQYNKEWIDRREGSVNVKKPVLVIMEEGMGSRYGGLKHIDPIDE